MTAIPYSRRHFLQSTASLAAAIALSPCARAATAPPLNVVLILVDDMGWTGPACYGSDLHETPNLDRLAQQGVRFTNAYSASPVCSPTRASIMTGRHPARLNMTIWRESAVNRLKGRGNRPLASPITEPDLSLEYRTIAEVMQGAEYHTTHIGKWHLGDTAHYPEAHGFDDNVGATIWGAPKTYWYPYRGGRTEDTGDYEYRYIPHLELGEPGEYLTDRLTSEAIKTLEQVHEKPFFLHMAYHTPHTPIEGKPELVERYKQKIRPGMTHSNAEYAAMVHSLDQNVGRLLNTLEKLNVADRTLVIFVSDNGGYTNLLNGQQITNNVPLRSGKGSLYEGGIRVPMIVRWPGVAQEGAVCDVPVISTDLYPTTLAATALAGDESHNRVLDGLDLVPLLKNPQSSLARETLYWHYPHYYFNTTPVSAVRHGEWKLLEYYDDGRVELFNLKDDQGETTDLAAAKPEVARELQGMLHAWRKEVDAKAPEPNPEAAAG